MTEKQLKEILTDGKSLIEQRLKEYMSLIADENDPVKKAMEYSLMIGGKRLRPILTLQFCKACGVSEERAVPFACAVEMIHTYSLIHDDLPCMDNDDLRRGKPSCHIAFGEENALLAGDGLLNLAFETVSGRFGDIIMPAENQIKAIGYLSSCSGIDGMIGGQTLDLMSENKSISLQQLIRIHSLKTGAMIRSACVLGAIVAGADKKTVECAEIYGNNIGLAFQIIDDILDITGDEKALGKPVGSDRENKKSTFPTLLGIKTSREYAQELTQSAKEVLSAFENAEFLSSLADYLLHREK